MYNFSISAEKTPYRRSPTPKKEIKYSASGAKIYKEDIVEPIMNNQNLFSQDLGDDENNKSPFSFLKKPNPVVQPFQSNKNREAFNNITNTINKSHIKEEKEVSKKNIENLVPKALNFEQGKVQNSLTNS